MPASGPYSHTSAEGAPPLSLRHRLRRYAWCISIASAIAEACLSLGRGPLVCSGEGDEAGRLSFAHEEFLHELKDDSLTIRSTDRAYRFKAAEATGKGQLAEIVKSLSRLRK